MLNSPLAARLSAIPSHWILAVLAVVVAAVFAGQGVNLFSVWQGKDIDSARLAMRSQSSNTQSGIGLEQVAKLHLFGEKSNEPVAVVSSPSEVPSTNLKMALVGAMTNSDAAKASALIATDKQTSRFFVGESIVSGVVLQEVRSDSVVLKRNGKLETLSFPRASESSAGVAPSGRHVGLGGGLPRSVLPAAPDTRPLATQQRRPLSGNPRLNTQSPRGLPQPIGN